MEVTVASRMALLGRLTMEGGDGGVDMRGAYLVSDCWERLTDWKVKLKSVHIYLYLHINLGSLFGEKCVRLYWCESVITVLSLYLRENRGAVGS